MSETTNENKNYIDTHPPVHVGIIAMIGGSHPADSDWFTARTGRMEGIHCLRWHIKWDFYRACYYEDMIFGVFTVCFSVLFFHPTLTLVGYL